MADDGHGTAPGILEPEALRSGFVYEPLAETDVRLIKIRPGIIGSPVIGEIAHVDLRTKPEFLALSYVWGSDAKTKEIQLNGHSVNITHNLYAALDRLRTYCKDFARMWIWIDALCIDQQNTAEKSFQVGRMTEIYGQAHAVCAWFGESNVDKEVDMATLFEDFESIRIYRESSPEERASMDDPALELLDWGANECLMELAVNPWFGRVWTLQEAVLSRSCRIYVGPHCTTLDVFLTRSVDVHDRETYNSLRLVDLVRSEVRTWSSSGTEAADEREMAQQLRLFLDCVRQRTSRVEHDAIYGVLGLWKLVRRAPLPKDMVPDYNLPYATVCHAYMTYLLRNTGVLNFVNSYNNGLANERTPSWVSDFRYLLPAWEPTLGNTSVFISANNRNLTLTGYQVGLVRGATSYSFWSRDDPVDRNVWTQAIAALEREIVTPLAHLKKNLTPDKARLHIIRAALYTGDSLDPRVERNSRECLTWYNHLRIATQAGLLSLETCGTYYDESKNTGTTTHVSDLVHMIISQAKAVVDNGTLLHIDRTDAQIEIGDVVCFCATDTQQALVIRPLPDGRFRFVSSGSLDFRIGADFDPSVYFHDEESREFEII